MDLDNVLAQLRKELEAVNAAILTLERLDGRSNRGPGILPDLAAKIPTNGANGVYGHLASVEK
jgi:hypothetical protein